MDWHSRRVLRDADPSPQGNHARPRYVGPLQDSPRRSATASQPVQRRGTCTCGRGAPLPTLLSRVAVVVRISALSYSLQSCRGEAHGRGWASVRVGRRRRFRCGRVVESDLGCCGSGGDLHGCSCYSLAFQRPRAEKLKRTRGQRGSVDGGSQQLPKDDAKALSLWAGVNAGQMYLLGEGVTELSDLRAGV